jgi:hypothetical protein
MMNNACPNRITETSGTGFSRDLSKNNIIILLFYRVLQRCLQVTPEIFPGQALAHCPKFSTADPIREFRPYLSSNVAVISLNPAKDRKLGKPLPYQQLNPIPAYYLVTTVYIYTIRDLP